LSLHSRSMLFYGVAACTLVLDQVTKAAARGCLTNSSRLIIPGFLKLELSFNSGAAFGLAQGFAPLIILLTLAAIFAIVKLRAQRTQSNALAIGLGLLTGGALGNLIDRLFMPDTDFLAIYIGDRSVWPTFNIADAAIVIGALFMFYYIYVLEKRHSEADEAPGASR
jgi:signal peptidase II